jgi:hypothetical protein
MFIEDLFNLGDSNPAIGERVKVTLFQPWGKHDPGFYITGTLRKTIHRKKKEAIGEIEIQGFSNKKNISMPWSKNFVTIELV